MAPVTAKSVRAAPDTKKSTEKESKKKATTETVTAAAVAPKKPVTRSDTVQKTAPAAKALATPATASPLKLTKRQQKAEKHQQVKGEKPADYDDGNWLTVPTKADRKKRTDELAAALVQKLDANVLAAAATVAAVSTKATPKQLKDQANKTKKEAADAAAAAKTEHHVSQTKAAAPVVDDAAVDAAVTQESQPIGVDDHQESSHTVVDGPAPSAAAFVDESDRQTAEIIEQIEDAIVDVDVDEEADDNDGEPAPTNFDAIVLKLQQQQQQKKLIGDVSPQKSSPVEKSAKISEEAMAVPSAVVAPVASVPVIADSNVAFDELAGKF